MWKQLFRSSLKGMAWGIGLSIGIALTTVFAVTITSVFNSGGNLTSGMLNELKTALVNLPNWAKGTTATDAVYMDGNVGIGTTTPVAKLEVTGEVRLSTNNARLNLQRTTGPNYLDFNDNKSMIFRSISSTGANAAPRMVIDNGTGNIGIGTTAPTGKLVVQLPQFTNRDNSSQHVIFSNSGNNDSGLRFGFDGVNLIGSINVLNPLVAWGDLILQAGGGKVGIGTGTTAPTATLEVACPVGFTNIKAGGNQLGCMQTSEQAATVSSWETAAQTCFTSYGGRLPTTGEWYIAMINSVLTSELGNWEWNDDLTGANTHAVSGNTLVSSQGMLADTITTNAYRCWLPR